MAPGAALPCEAWQGRVWCTGIVLYEVLAGAATLTCRGATLGACGAVFLCEAAIIGGGMQEGHALIGGVRNGRESVCSACVTAAEQKSLRTPRVEFYKAGAIGVVI